MTKILTDTAEAVLKKRYYLQNSESVPVEDWDILCGRVAGSVANNPLEADSFYKIIHDLDFLPNSPCLMNAGTELGQLSACFVLPIEDNLAAIFESIKNGALVNKTGGGTGFSFSRLRPKNSSVLSTQGVASGPLSFAKVFDSATDVIKQGGRRRGANMGVLRVDHPDIMDFIKAKEVEGDFSNFNFSVALTDEFMEAVIKSEPYFHMRDPATGQPVGTFEPAFLWDQIVKRAHNNGEPGVLFIDAANRANPTPHLGDYEATNPCGEQWLLPYESCNLGSINLGRFVLPGCLVDVDRLERVIKMAVQFLDNVVDKNIFPIPEIEKATKKTRKLGLGIMGLHDLLIKMGLPYDSEEGRKLASSIMHLIKHTATHESERLARDVGTYPAYNQDGSTMPQRNACLTSIQPTGTVSMIADCSSGCEPYFSIVAEKHVMDGDKLLVVNRLFEEYAREGGWYSPELMAKVAKTGTVMGHDEIPEAMQQLFKTAQDIAPGDHIKMQAILQEDVDSSISKTINMPNDATIEDVAKAYMTAWSLGCKGLTVYRDGSRDKQVLYAASTPKQATDPIKDVFLGTNATITVSQHGPVKRELPETLNAKRYRMTGRDGDKIYIIVCFDAEEKPVEVFAKFPFDNRSDMKDRATMWVTTCRLVSLLLRYGIPIEDIIKQLDKSSGHLRDLPAQLGKLLKTFMSQTSHGYEGSCPDCKGALIFQEGCERCESCGFSKCS